MRRWGLVVIPVLALALLAAGCQTQRRVDRAKTRFADGEYAGAARTWRSLARSGVPQAQHRLGIMLGIGQGVKRDETKSIQYFRAAADQGYLPSQQHLGHLYLMGKGAPESDPNALERLHETAQNGNADTKYRLGVLYFRGEIVEQNYDDGVAWMRKASEQWDTPQPVIVPRLLADDLLTSAAEHGLEVAQFRMAVLHAQGMGVPQSRAEALKWHYLAGSQGLVESQFALGSIYSNAVGVERDLAEAARWYRKAAEQGHVHSQYELGMIYSNGLGVPLDEVEAHAWFNVAAAEGHAGARAKRIGLEKQLSAADLHTAEAMAILLFAGQ